MHGNSLELTEGEKLAKVDFKTIKMQCFLSEEMHNQVICMPKHRSHNSQGQCDLHKHGLEGLKQMIY